MSEPVPSREGRVSRRPLILVLMILALVAIVGAVISNQARKETLASASSTTTSSIVADTAYPTVAPSSTPAAGSSPSSTAGAETGGSGCTPAALLAAADRSGQAAEGVIDSASVTRFNCIGDYAFARLAAPGLDEAEAYFKLENGEWDLLTLGTAVDPDSLDIPADTIRQLASD